MRIFPAYYLVGLTGKCFAGSGPEKRQQTRNGEDAPPHCVIVFPKVTNFSRFETRMDVISDTNYYWFRLIKGDDYREYMAWEMFPLKSWTDYMSRHWHHTIHPMARGTWEVAPDISNVRDYYFLDHGKGLTLSDEGSKYKARPLDRPGATKQLREP
jgi:hypothetical protein